MTGTEKIKAKILEDAEVRAGQILEQARAEAREIIDNALKEAEQKRSDILRKGESDGREVYRRMMSEANLEGRKEVLKAKQDLVESAFSLAMDKLCKLSDQDYQKLLEDMAVEAAKDEDGEILLSEQDRNRVSKDFVKNINKRIASSGKNGKLALSQDTIKTVGGFVLRYDQMEINNTFEVIFEMLKPKLENDVVKILFS
ncbi:MAG TPA: V-type ATP synthase subunit E [Thermoclostridium sp.]